MTRKTAARLQRALDAVMIAMDSYIPQGVLVGAWTLLFVMAIQALPWIIPGAFQ